MASFPLRSLSSLKVAAGDMLLERRRPQPAPDDASSADLYLAPHFDDICFSLGAYVRRRRRGILLTLFSTSRYVARPDELQIKASERTAAISALRLAEDLAFARQVGLRQLTAGLDEAPVRGREPFDTDKAAADAILLDTKVIDAIFAAAPERAAGPRPWLYCPMGIGGHVDHVAVLTIVLKHYEALRASYRIAFYEDLHYASAWTLRVAGLRRFLVLAAPLKPRRSRHAIGAPHDKLALASLYPSQFVEPPLSIAPFTPAQFFQASAHEATWTPREP